MTAGHNLPGRWPAATYAMVCLTVLSAARPGCGLPDIDSVGSWTETINSADLQAGAGSNLNATYTSSSSQAVIQIFNTPSYNEAWKVDVRRTDTNWHGSFTLNTRRTSNGVNPSGASGNFISGGTTYRAITTTDALFFWGAYDRSNVNIQFQLTGMSVQIPPATYTTTVVFTATLN